MPFRHVIIHAIEIGPEYDNVFSNRGSLSTTSSLKAMAEMASQSTEKMPSNVGKLHKLLLRLEYVYI
jgi:hypothetical protein